MTAKELAVSLIKPYVLRGDDPDWIHDGGLGRSSDDGYVHCGGNLNGKRFPTHKIIVSRLGDWETGVEVSEVFDFYKLCEEIKAGAAERVQLTLF